MSTIAETRRLLQPYVGRHDDLALVGRAVIIRPVRHLICGFYVDRSGSKNWVKPFWFVHLMFTPWAIQGFDWTGRRYPEHADIDNAATQAAIFQDMDSAFAELRGILDQFSAYGVRLEVNRKLQEFPFYRGVIAAAEGDFQRAMENLRLHAARQEGRVRDRLAFIEKHTRPHGRPRQRELASLGRIEAYLDAIRTLMSLLVDNDRQGVACLLRKWERGTVRAWKIEHLWQPTPFPFERGGRPVE